LGGDTNLYLYAGGDPVNWTDVSGLQPCADPRLCGDRPPKEKDEGKGKCVKRKRKRQKKRERKKVCTVVELPKYECIRHKVSGVKEISPGVWVSETFYLPCVWEKKMVPTEMCVWQ